MYMWYDSPFLQNEWCWKNVFGEIQKYMYCKKMILDHINEIPPLGGRELICHAMSLHPWSMPSMSVVSNFMINNISEKQVKQNRWKNVVSLSSEYTVIM